ncbi:MAG: hypothetical protein WC362_01475 [Methanoregula sp.]|jgi:hypothetical protein
MFMSSQNFSRHFGFLSGQIRAYKLSTGTFLDFPDFEPEKNLPEKFRANFFCDFQLSRQNFSGKKTFTAKKSPGFPVSPATTPTGIYDGGAATCTRHDRFFQLSTGKILDFKNFEPKKDRPENFRGKKIRPYRISNQKFLAGKMFKPYAWSVIARIFFGGVQPLRRKNCMSEGFFRISRRSFGNFWARTLENPKIPGTTPFPRQKRIVFPVHIRRGGTITRIPGTAPGSASVSTSGGPTLRHR